MFFHLFRYELKKTLRERDVIFWMMIFPIFLGTVFHIAFGDLYNVTETFKSVPVAVVGAEKDPVLSAVLDGASSGDEPMFDVKKTDRETALKMLKDEKVSGIINAGSDLSLSFASNGLKSSIIKSFADRYKCIYSIINDTLRNSPEKLEEVTASLNSSAEVIDDASLNDKGNYNFYSQYFFALIAMVALYGTTSGMSAAIRNEGNLSKVGARKCVSPANRSVSLLASLFSAYIQQLICVIIAITYVLFVLKEKLGDDYFRIYLTGAVGTLSGVAIGFFVGTIGTASEAKKNAILSAITLILCFFSGLMVGNMKAVVEKSFPLFNRINPASLISEMYYCLTIYDNDARYLRCLYSLLIITAVFTTGGIIMTRRKSYASL